MFIKKLIDLFSAKKAEKRPTLIQSVEEPIEPKTQTELDAHFQLRCAFTLVLTDKPVRVHQGDC